MANQISVLLTLSFLFTFLKSISAGLPTFSVVALGAKPDGKTDSTKYFQSAWSSACNSTISAVVYVPQGKYLVGAARFEGSCNNNNVIFHIDGTLIAPSDYRSIDGNWIQFHSVNGVTIQGGTLDGQGSLLWACKKSGNNCPSGAMSLVFMNSNNIKIYGLTSLNSQSFHIAIVGCQNVNLQGVNILAPADSPNTDGIHLQESSEITILSSVIGTGDDCISMGPGTTNVWIEHITCGPGHGISIGSLGRSSQEAGVQNVTAKTVTFNETQNGFRIKTWAKPSTAFVKDITFQNGTMVNVQNPIIVDQNYCDPNRGCPNEGSGVQVSNVTYSSIHGTSATKVTINFDCSDKYPCTRMTLYDINLISNNNTDNDYTVASCAHASGISSGFVKPPSCLN